MDKIYRTPEEAVLAFFRQHELTFAAAESCTGGLIAKRITDLAGASAVFRGGVVSYTNEVKRAVLGVPQHLLDEYGAVSAPVAEAMAEGARRITNADFAISVTGVAGPDRDERGNPVGTVFIGLAGSGGVTHLKRHYEGDRTAIRSAAADDVFACLLRAAKDQHPTT